MKEGRIVRQLDRMVAWGRVTEEEVVRLRATDWAGPRPTATWNGSATVSIPTGYGKDSAGTSAIQAAEAPIWGVRPQRK